jgi:MFS family permease
MADGAGGTGRVGVITILRDRDVRVVVVGMLVVMLGWGILGPVLPLYARSFGVGYGSVGLLMSSFAFTRLLFDLFAGSMIRRWGERAVVTAGAVIVGVSSLLAAMAPNFTLLVILRGAGGAGSSMFFIALMSYMLRTAPRDRVGRVMSVFYGAFNIGVILGAPIGGFLGHAFGLASPLVAYGIACLASAALYLKTIRDPEPTQETPTRGSLRDLRWSREFVAVLVSNAAYFWMVAAVFQTLLSPFANDEIGLSLPTIGLLLSIPAATELAALFPAGSLTDRLGRRAVLVPSTLGLAAVVGVLGLANRPVTFAIALVALGIVSGFGGVSQPVMLADVIPERNRAAAIGVYRFVGDLGFVLGPLVAGEAASAFGFGTAFALSAIPSLVAVGFLLSIRETGGDRVVRDAMARRTPSEKPTPAPPTAPPMGGP